MQHLVAILLSAGISIAGAHEYHPLQPLPGTETQPIDLLVKDASRDREIPLRVYLPSRDGAGSAQLLPGSSRPSPVVLFSHGLGGSREGSAFLGRHWSARGYVAVFLQHPGSDESVWKDQPLGKRMAAMREAASFRSFLLRVQDVPVVLDQLAKWNEQASHPLAGQLDLRRVGMSGHSFGAQTTQAVSGQNFALGGQRLTDPRIKAAIVMSPGSPERGPPTTAFAQVRIPWLLMTGTQDTAPIGGQTVASRRAVYPALPAGDKFELVLDKAEHSVFTERPLPGDAEPRNPNHHRAILALSTAFWDAYLRDDPAAKQWLLGDGPRRVIEPVDLWQNK